MDKIFLLARLYMVQKTRIKKDLCKNVEIQGFQTSSGDLIRNWQLAFSTMGDWHEFFSVPKMHFMKVAFKIVRIFFFNFQRVFNFLTISGTKLKCLKKLI